MDWDGRGRKGGNGRTLLQTPITLSEIQTLEIDVQVRGEEGGELVVAAAAGADELDQSIELILAQHRLFFILPRTKTRMMREWGNGRERRRTQER